MPGAGYGLKTVVKKAIEHDASSTLKSNTPLANDLASEIKRNSSDIQRRWEYAVAKTKNKCEYLIKTNCNKVERRIYFTKLNSENCTRLVYELANILGELTAQIEALNEKISNCKNLISNCNIEIYKSSQDKWLCELIAPDEITETYINAQIKLKKYELKSQALAKIKEKVEYYYKELIAVRNNDVPNFVNDAKQILTNLSEFCEKYFAGLSRYFHSKLQPSGSNDNNELRQGRLFSGLWANLYNVINDTVIFYKNLILEAIDELDNDIVRLDMTYNENAIVAQYKKYLSDFIGLKRRKLLFTLDFSRQKELALESLEQELAALVNFQNQSLSLQNKLILQELAIKLEQFRANLAESNAGLSHNYWINIKAGFENIIKIHSGALLSILLDFMSKLQKLFDKSEKCKAKRQLPKVTTFINRELRRLQFAGSFTLQKEQTLQDISLKREYLLLEHEKLVRKLEYDINGTNKELIKSLCATLQKKVQKLSQFEKDVLSYQSGEEINLNVQAKKDISKVLNWHKSRILLNDIKLKQIQAEITTGRNEACLEEQLKKQMHDLHFKLKRMLLFANDYGRAKITALEEISKFEEEITIKLQDDSTINRQNLPDSLNRLKGELIEESEGTLYPVNLRIKFANIQAYMRLNQQRHNLGRMEDQENLLSHYNQEIANSGAWSKKFSQLVKLNHLIRFEVSNIFRYLTGKVETAAIKVKFNIKWTTKALKYYVIKPTANLLSDAASWVYSGINWHELLSIFKKALPLIKTTLLKASRLISSGAVILFHGLKGASILAFKYCSILGKRLIARPIKWLFNEIMLFAFKKSVYSIELIARGIYRSSLASLHIVGASIFYGLKGVLLALNEFLLSPVLRELLARAQGGTQHIAWLATNLWFGFKFELLLLKVMVLGLVNIIGLGILYGLKGFAYLAKEYIIYPSMHWASTIHARPAGSSIFQSLKNGGYTILFFACEIINKTIWLSGASVIGAYHLIKWPSLLIHKHIISPTLNYSKYKIVEGGNYIKFKLIKSLVSLGRSLDDHYSYNQISRRRKYEREIYNEYRLWERQEFVKASNFVSV